MKVNLCNKARIHTTIAKTFRLSRSFSLNIKLTTLAQISYLTIVYSATDAAELPKGLAITIHPPFRKKGCPNSLFKAALPPPESFHLIR